MAALHLDPKLTREAIQTAITDMVAASGFRNSYVAMVCSRGVPKIPGSRDPRQCENYFYAWCVHYAWVIPPAVIEQGASACLATSVQRIPDGSLNPAVKTYHWGDFTRGLFEAKEKNFETVILLDQAGHVIEGLGFNVFFIKGDTVMTSGHGVLGGITRRSVVEIAQTLGLRVEIAPLPRAELLSADEVFISSSAWVVIPLVNVEGKIFSNGFCGPVTKTIHTTYWDWMRRPEHRTEITYAT